MELKYNYLNSKIVQLSMAYDDIEQYMLEVRLLANIS